MHDLDLHIVAIRAVLILAGFVGITIIEQIVKVAAAYEIEQVKQCRHSLSPGESFYGLVIPVNYDIEKVKCCNKKC
jgi:hypothetical protein